MHETTEKCKTAHEQDVSKVGEKSLVVKQLSTISLKIFETTVNTKHDINKSGLVTILQISRPLISI